MAKLIFLDIDGVLNSSNYTLSQYADQKNEYRDPVQSLDSNALKLLKMVVAETKADIVISSTWRKEFTIPELKTIFAEAGWPDIPVIGYTPATIKNFRGEEVAQFLDLFTQDNDLDGFVIIDDSSDYYIGDDLDASFRFNQPLVLTDARIGFCYKDVLGVFYYLCPEHPLVSYLKEEVNFKSKVSVPQPWITSQAFGLTHDM